MMGLRDELRSAAKTSHRLQSEVHELEHVIGLHIHNRMAVQSKVAERRGLPADRAQHEPARHVLELARADRALRARRAGCAA